MRDSQGDLNDLGVFVVGVLVVAFVIGLIGLAMWALPKYGVWTKELNGQAKLKEAAYSKQVQIEEAKANLEAEKLNAKAEVERAKGMAKAMEVEGGKLTDEYIKYLWVKTMAKQKKSTIYIPTEASLPLLEAK